MSLLPPPEPGGGVAALRRYLDEAGFAAKGVTERLGLQSIFDFRTLRGRREDMAPPGQRPASRPSGDGLASEPSGDGPAGQPPTDRLALLIHLFMDGEVVLREQAAEILGKEGMGLLEANGLLTGHPHDPGAVAAAALLYPVGPILIASDVNEQAPGASPDGGVLHPDSVYPALTDAARGFLRDLPDPRSISPEARVLDLCAGTGVAGLLLAPRALEVVMADLTERCARFAHFNAALNGMENVRVARGDLWEAVGGERFDLVVAHPPYRPASNDRYIFRDAGPDGERLLRGVVSGAPAHLNPGGLLYVRGTAVDREGAPVEARLRGLLGEAHEEFDVFAAVSAVHTPEAYLARAAEGPVGEGSAAPVGVSAFVHGSFLIQRRVEERTVATVRRIRSPSADGRALAWMRQSEVAALRPFARKEILRRSPRLRDGVEVEVRYRVEQGQLRNRGCRVGVDAPFRVAVDLPGSASRFLPLFNGRRRTLRVLEEGVKQGSIPAGTPPEEFAGLVQALLLAGILEVEGAELPPAEG